ncbi:MAG TPA: hypothetical protein VGN60_00725 [Devosia sp.]|jgi:hypothetical protein|nr:hypothetical protein [Devosia sp.]
MSIFVPANPGTVTFTQGSMAIAGTGTLFQNMRAGSVISIPGLGEMQLAEDPTSDTAALGVVEWQGTTAEDKAYQYLPRNDAATISAKLVAMLQQLSGSNLQSLADVEGAAQTVLGFAGPGSLTTVAIADLVSGADYDQAVDALADLAAYSTRPGPTADSRGFAVLVRNSGDGRAAIYSKSSDASGDWSDPAYVSGPAITLDVTEVDAVPHGAPPGVTLTPVAGGYNLAFAIPSGMIIVPGTTTTLAPDQPAAVDFVPVTGGYRIDISIPQGLTGDIDGVTPFWVSRLGADATAGAALTGLGVSAFAQSLLDDASAAAFFSTLGQIPNSHIRDDLTPDKAFRRGNILGTVSHLSGGPSGALIESGSNGNGSYARFANGTQICICSSSVDFNNTSYQLFSYPAAFATADVGLSLSFAGSPTTGDVNDWLNRLHQVTAVKSSSTIGLMLFRAATYGALSGLYGPVNVIAAGRWF